MKIPKPTKNDSSPSGDENLSSPSDDTSRSLDEHIAPDEYWYPNSVVHKIGTDRDKKIAELQAEFAKINIDLSKKDAEIERLSNQFVGSYSWRELTEENRKLRELLRECRTLLDDYRFSSDDEEEYNNDDVIDLSAKLDAFLGDENE